MVSTQTVSVSRLGMVSKLTGARPVGPYLALLGLASVKPKSVKILPMR